MNGVLTGVAAPTSSVTVLPALFVTQMLPALSIANSEGLLKFDPVGKKLPNRVPVLVKAVKLLLVGFATQTLPEPSISSPNGLLIPVAPKSPYREPSLFRAVTVVPLLPELFPEFATQTRPEEPSTAIPAGPWKSESGSKMPAKVPLLSTTLTS